MLCSNDVGGLRLCSTAFVSRFLTYLVYLNVDEDKLDDDVADLRKEGFGVCAPQTQIVIRIMLNGETNRIV